MFSMFRDLGVMNKVSNNNLKQFVKLGPTKINTCHLIKVHIKRSIKIPQPLQDQRIDVRMTSTFRFAQAMRSRMPLAFE